MNLSSARNAELFELAHKARRRVLAMTERGGCFAGAALSCVDLITYLYSEQLRVTPASRSSASRDYFLLSKGHAVPALYAVLAELGFVSGERLERHLSVSDFVYWHPNPAIPGVEFHSGSLGHLLSVGMGIAYDARLSGTDNQVFVLLGDGELDEGSIWEGLLVASALALTNLTVIIDRNRLQANCATEALTPLEPLGDKLQSFGLRTSEIDGHDFMALARAFGGANDGRPHAVVANTVRGKGVPSLENRADAWFLKGPASAWLTELESGRARLVSERHDP